MKPFLKTTIASTLLLLGSIANAALTFDPPYQAMGPVAKRPFAVLNVKNTENKPSKLQILVFEDVERTKPVGQDVLFIHGLKNQKLSKNVWFEKADDENYKKLLEAETPFPGIDVKPKAEMGVRIFYKGPKLTKDKVFFLAVNEVKLTEGSDSFIALTPGQILKIVYKASDAQPVLTVEKLEGGKIRVSNNSDAFYFTPTMTADGKKLNGPHYISPETSFTIDAKEIDVGTHTDIDKYYEIVKIIMGK